VHQFHVISRVVSKWLDTAKDRVSM